MDTEHNLIFGTLAFQNDYIDLVQFADACRAWTADKSRPLAELIVERGWINERERAVLDQIVARKLQRFGDDPRAVFDAVADDAIRDVLSGLGESLPNRPFDAAPAAAPFVLVETLVKPPDSPPSTHATERLGGSTDSHPRSALAETLVKHPDATSAISPTGTLVGPTHRSRYTLTRLAGEGGLGKVWLARDLDLNREVALKELRPSQAVHAEAWRRFLTEAQITGQLEHPNIVPVYELARRPEDNQPFYTMRFVRGQTLRDAIADYHAGRTPARRASDGSTETRSVSEAAERTDPRSCVGLVSDPLTFRRLIQAFVGVCNALAYAHSRGVIHRDLKPDNVVLGSFGEVIVLDWGLAKLVDRDDSEPSTVAVSPDARSDATLAGIVMGTPAYMAPEQAEGRVDLIDAKTDVYGLGAILFEILTGRPPHEGQDTAKLLSRIVSADSPRARSIDSTVPAVLDAVCAKAMAHERQQRYSRAAELADDVQRWLADEPTAAYAENFFQQIARWSRRHRTWAQAGVAAVALVAVISLVAFFAIRRQHRFAMIARDVAVSAQKMEERQRLVATENLRQAQDARRATEALRLVAVAREKEVRRNLATLLVTNGNILLDAGDWGGALLWYVAALRLADVDADTDAESARVHRVRVAMTLRLLARPTTMWTHDDLVARQGVFKQFLSPDCRRVVTCEAKGSAHVCDALTGRPLTPAMPHAAPVTFARFSVDGSRVVTVCQDRTARVWDAATGKPLSPPLPQQDDLTIDDFGPEGKAEFSPDGRFVVVTGLVPKTERRRVRAWDVDKALLVFPPLEFEGELAAVNFSPDGKRLMVANKVANTVQIHDAATGDQTDPTIRDPGLWFACFSPDGRLLATTSGDGTAMVWDAVTGEEVTPSLMQSGPVTFATFSADSQILATVTSEKTARVWDVKTGKAIGTPMKHADRPFAERLNSSGSRLVTFSFDKTARVWDVRTSRPLSPVIALGEHAIDGDFLDDQVIILTSSAGYVWDFSRSADPGGVRIAGADDVNVVRFSSDSSKIVANSDKGVARLFDAATGRPIGTGMKHADAVLDVECSPNGRFVATASKDGTARVWSAADGSPVASLLEHKGPVNHARFSADSSRLVTSSDDNTARVWDAATGKPLVPAIEHGGAVSDAVFSPDGRFVATASADSTARVWDATTGAPVTGPLDTDDKPNVRMPAVIVRFSPDGKLLLTGDENGYLRLWEPTGRPISKPMRYGSATSEADFSSDGRRIAAAGYENFVKVWDTATPDESPAVLASGFYSIFTRFGIDGSTLFTSSFDGGRLWDTAAGTPLGPFLPLAKTADFSRDGRRLMTVDQKIRLWDITPDPRPADDLDKLARVLSGRTIDTRGAVVPLDAAVRRQLREELLADDADEFAAARGVEIGEAASR